MKADIDSFLENIDIDLAELLAGLQEDQPEFMKYIIDNLEEDIKKLINSV